MINLDVTLVTSLVQPTCVPERELVHPVGDRLITSGVSDENSGDDVITVDAGADYLANNVGPGALGNQISRVENTERLGCLELIGDLLQARGVPILVAPIVAERITLTVDASNPTLVNARRYRGG